jgi:RNA polymerase sigma factor, sigma-70 family
MDTDTHYATYVDSIDKAELDDLMTQYGDDVVQFAYMMTRNRERAKDIAQEAFIRAYTGIHAYRGQSSIRTWLLAITRNLALNELKSSYLRRMLLFERVRSAERTPSAEEAFFGQQAEKKIWEIVMALPTKLREALMLQVHYGMTVAEIADMLQVSEGTVKSRLFRARRQVESKWREDGCDDE